MDMKLRPMTPAERKYSYTQEQQIMMQCICIGHLRGDFGADGNEFFTTWDDHYPKYNTPEFKTELGGVINALREVPEYGAMLKDRLAMTLYGHRNQDSGFDGNYCREFGFRADTESHAYLIRCNPNPGDYNFYIYTYASNWLDRHMENAERGIRFIDSRYNELFRIGDGEKIIVTYSSGETSTRACRYIDETHVYVGSELYHICQFAEIMERNTSRYEPAGMDFGTGTRTPRTQSTRAR